MVSLKALHIPLSFLFPYAPAAVSTPLMPVHTTENKPLSIEFHHLVPDLYLSESYVIRNDLCKSAIRIHHPDLHTIQIRIAVAPRPDFPRYRQDQFHLFLPWLFFLRHRLALSIQKGQFYLSALFPGKIHAGRQHTGLLCRIILRTKPQILQMHRRSRHQIHIPENTEETEEVLVLQVRRHRLFIYFDRQHITLLPDHTA